MIHRLALVLPALLLGACGYHVAGRADLVPKTIKSISIPAFGNVTNRPKLTDQLPEAFSREFIARTRYHIVADPNVADAILNGAVINYGSFPTVTDNGTATTGGTGRATAVDVRVYLQISLVERATGKVIFSRSNLEVRDHYEISLDPGTYFEESDAALSRVSKQVAQQVVSAILENF